MPRRAAAVRREIAPDSVYNKRLVTQLTNKVLLDGKKSTAENIVYGAFDIIEQKTAAAQPEILKVEETTYAKARTCCPARNRP